MARQAINRGSSVNDATAESIFNAFGKVNSMTTDLYKYTQYNVLDYGAVGDADVTTAAGTDDTTAFTSAIAAAVAATPAGSADVFIPGGRNYKITSTISVPNNVRLIGGVHNKEDSGSPARIIWGGAVSGTMFDVALPQTNITCVVFRDLWIGGRSDGTNRPDTLIKFRGTSGFSGKPDSGTYIEGCWFFGCRSHAISFGAGATNMYFWGCRWDVCGSEAAGYGIYCDMSTGFSCYIGGHTTFTCEAGAGGFMFLDAESKTTGVPFATVQCDSLKIEIGGSLAQSFASGTSPFDRRGVFRLGTNGNDLGIATHHIFCDALEVEDPGAISAYSIFQVTGSLGTDLQSCRMVNLIVNGGSGLSTGTNDAGTTDQVRIIGGRIPSTRRQPLPGSLRWNKFRYSIGAGGTSETHVSWDHQQANYIDYPILGPVTTVANLVTTVGLVRDGQRAFVTDATTTTFAADVVGGGSNHVPVYYNSATATWKIG